METLEEIGGYFELELRKGEHYHKGAIRLNSGRNCFEYILRARGYKKVYMPYYTCQVMFDTATRCGVEILCYRINEQLEPIELPKLNFGEAFLYTNYYGLKQPCVERFAERYGKQLIVDNAQAFYTKPIAGIDTFYSPRKFFGVPDGGYLYTDAILNEELPQARSYERMSHLLKRIEYGAQAGYDMFKKNQKSFGDSPIERMSKLTCALLENIDYETALKRRRNNYMRLHEELYEINTIEFALGDAVPIVYPFMTKDVNLRARLIENNIYVASYWPKVENNDSVESLLKERLIPLPIDQRYGEKEMQKIINVIKG